MKRISLVIFNLYLLCQTQTLYVTIENKPKCIILAEPSGNQTHFFYQVTGNNADNFRVDFLSQQGNSSPFSLNGQVGETKFTSKKMKVCLVSTDSQIKSVSIDFYSDDVAHLAQLATKSQMQSLQDKLFSVGTKIKDIVRNQIFQEEKQTIHGRTIQQHQAKVKNIVIFKVIAILIVAVAQIYLLKILLNNQKRGYQVIGTA